MRVSTDTVPTNREEVIKEFVAAYIDIASKVLSIPVEHLEIMTEDQPDGGITVGIFQDGQPVTDEQARLVDQTVRSFLTPSN